MNARVLVADDCDHIRFTIRFALEQVGYAVTEFDNGVDAAAALERGGYACALLDNQMPGLTGVEVVRAARAMGDRTPMALVTGSVTPDDLPFVSPPVFLVTKPFQVFDLIALVDRLAERGQPDQRTPRGSWLSRLVRV
jgi:CheY-like chemotaxis protein